MAEQWRKTEHYLGRGFSCSATRENNLFCIITSLVSAATGLCKSLPLLQKGRQAKAGRGTPLMLRPVLAWNQGASQSCALTPLEGVLSNLGLSGPENYHYRESLSFQDSALQDSALQKNISHLMVRARVTN